MTPFATIVGCAAIGIIGCGKIAPEASREPESPPRCGVREGLTTAAVRAARAWQCSPDDRALLDAAVEVATRLGVHERVHHGRDRVLDRHGIQALLPALARAGLAAEDCVRTQRVARAYLLAMEYEQAYRLHQRQGWACISGRDAAWVATGLHDGPQAIALVAEVWPRATPGEYGELLDAVSHHSLDHELEANLAFAPPDVRATYLRVRELRRLGEDVSMELRYAHAEMVDSCRSECLSLYGVGDSACDRTCAGDGSCRRSCDEFGRLCHAGCGQ